MTESIYGYSSDSLSINNGTSFTTVADLTDEQVADALASGHCDASDFCEADDDAIGDGEPLGEPSGENDREWLADYCRLHLLRHCEPLVIG